MLITQAIGPPMIIMMIRARVSPSVMTILQARRNIISVVSSNRIRRRHGIGAMRARNIYRSSRPNENELTYGVAIVSISCPIHLRILSLPIAQLRSRRDNVVNLVRLPCPIELRSVRFPRKITCRRKLIRVPLTTMGLSCFVTIMNRIR